MHQRWDNLSFLIGPRRANQPGPGISQLLHRSASDDLRNVLRRFTGKPRQNAEAHHRSVDRWFGGSG
jgi:hypothetical protein